MQIKGRAAIVTGGGGGVGRAVSLALGRGGCSVLVNYARSRESAEQTARQLRDLGVNALAYQADVTDDAACRHMADQAVAAFGQLNILINNAGYTRFIPADDLEAIGEDDWNQILAVNVRAPFQCVRAARSALLDAGGGEVVNISSVAAFSANGSSLPYCASKAALNNLTVALARCLAPKIRVNAVAPGFIAGRWLQQGLGDAYEAAKAAFERRLPLGKVCGPDDVAECVLSLINGSDLVTGQTLICDGGMQITTPWSSVASR